MEKLQWLKFFYYKEQYGNYVDKFEVRKFIEETIGGNYLNDFIAVYDTSDEIKFDELPDQFAMKCTHGSGYNLIVKDKSKLDIRRAKDKLNKFLKRDYSKENGENIYKGVKPRILVEKYLDQSGSNIIDYKFFCFHGEPKYIWVKTFNQGLYKNCYYDLDWNKIGEEEYRDNFLADEIARPQNLEEMIDVARKLSDPFIFMRVDLYSIDEKVYFGELTFFPWGGKQRLTVERFNNEFGELIKLPKTT
ncbi:MAG: ATP-grasp fold amidoligase family protein [Flavobacterium sp.]